MNPVPSDDILSYHGETTGAPGFTGRSPAERCVLVGTSCDSEVMYPGRVAPIDGWVATIYHRGLIMRPTALLVGGGKMDSGPAVMDANASAGLLVGPVMFPIGRYDGELEFGAEAPDPVQACAEAGQPVTPRWGPS